ncbi:MAG: UDP-N-acetylmuramoyl-tripeptide--D-alanyl-D-alanine ligase, partial [Actinomycetota bacterium]|nr:UDP-N-acetylmuramoyl-tripeptide--D-alanyl-D-alanine ligase [Actinomycetota bacterium]
QFDENARFGRQAAMVADVLVVVAKTNRDAITRGAQGAGTAEVMTVDSLAEASARLREVLRAGDVVLFENDLPDHYEN